MPQSLKTTPRRLYAWVSGGLLKPWDFRYWLEARREKSAPAEHDAPKDYDFRHLSFTFAVIAISARVALAGGNVSRERYVAFRESFPLKGGICSKIRALFSLACRDHMPLEHYVTQVKELYPGQQELFISLLDRLFGIAAADGKISAEDERMLAKIAHGLGVNAGDYWNIRARWHRPSAHQVLGVRRGSKSGIVKQRYRELMQRYHPDRYGDEELSPELQLLLQMKSSEINEAYRRLSKKAA